MVIPERQLPWDLPSSSSFYPFEALKIHPLFGIEGEKKNNYYTANMCEENKLTDWLFGLDWSTRSCTLTRLCSQFPITMFPFLLLLFFLLLSEVVLSGIIYIPVPPAKPDQCMRI